MLHAFSQSMWPMIDKGDEIEGVKVEMDAVRTGDIIIFYSPKLRKIVVHRIVKFNKNSSQWTLVTRGDNNFQSDGEKVLAKDLLGKVSTIRKNNIVIRLERGSHPLLGKRNTLLGKIYRKLFFYFFDKPGFYRLVQKFF